MPGEGADRHDAEPDPRVVPDGLLSGFSKFTFRLWALLFVLAACLATAIWLGTNFLDAYSRDRSLHLASASLKRSGAAVGFVARDYGVWDEADENLNVKYDPAWAKRLLGDWASNDMNMQKSAVVDADGKLIFLMSEGTSDASPGSDQLTAAMAELARQAQALTWDNPEALNTFLMIGDTVYLAAAAPVTPETPSAERIKENRRSVLMFMRALDESWIETFSKDFLLPDLRFIRAYDAESGTSLPLFDSEGQLLGALDWQPERPGSLLVEQIGPWLALLGLICAAIVAAAIRHQRRLMRHALALIDTLKIQNGALGESKQQLSHALGSEQRSNRTKREFLAFMSHEMRTPLNSIIGFSQFMQSQALGPVGSPKYLEYATDINGAGRHLLGMIDEVLDFSRVESEQLTLQLDQVELAEIVKFCRSQLEPFRRTKDIEIEAVLPDEPVVVHGDEGRLRQIILNLASNAIKASPVNGRIRVRVAARNGNAFLRLVDHGSGIAPQDMARIFEPFERAKPNGKAYGDGIGLGLPIVKRLVAAHGGAVRIWSKPALGTIAEVRLPLMQYVPRRQPAVVADLPAAS